MALALDFVEQSQSYFGELGLVCGELCPAEGSFEDRSPEAFDHVGKCHWFTS
jgi:hypothetical protein